MAHHLIFHMCLEEDWPPGDGDYHGSEQDRRDGFIHFSTARQIIESAARHRAGQSGLLVAVNPDSLGPALRWERSRDGDRFPHLYGALPKASVCWIRPLPLGPDGRHRFPRLEEAAV